MQIIHSGIIFEAVKNGVGRKYRISIEYFVKDGGRKCCCLNYIALLSEGEIVVSVKIELATTLSRP